MALERKIDVIKTGGEFNRERAASILLYRGLCDEELSGKIGVVICQESGRPPGAATCRVRNESIVHLERMRDNAVPVLSGRLSLSLLSAFFSANVPFDFCRCVCVCQLSHTPFLVAREKQQQ